MKTVVVYIVVTFLVSTIYAHACAMLGDDHEREDRSRGAVFAHMALSREEQLTAAKQELTEAIKAGDGQRVAHAIACGAQLDFREWEDTVVLMSAAKRGSIEAIDLLLDPKAIVGQRRNYGVGIAFHGAVIGGNVKMMERLAAAGAPIDEPVVDGSTPLIMVAAGCHKSAVRWLLRAGAFIDTCNDKGSTALIAAVDNGAKVDLVHILLGAKASVNMKEKYERGDTALSAAIMKCRNYPYRGADRLAVIQELVLAGANPRIFDAEGKSPWDEATEEMKSIMKQAGKERENAQFISEIVTVRGLRSPRLLLQLPCQVAILIDEFATTSSSKRDSERRFQVLEKSRKRWLAETHGVAMDEGQKVQFHSIDGDFVEGMKWASRAWVWVLPD